MSIVISKIVDKAVIWIGFKTSHSSCAGLYKFSLNYEHFFVLCDTKNKERSCSVHSSFLEY